MVARLATAPLAFEIARSSHCPAFYGQVVRCVNCLQMRHCLGGTMTVNVRAWLQSACPGPEHPTPPLGLIACGRRPTRVPQLATVLVGGAALHPSHSLMHFRGLYYCKRCGYVAAHRALKLVHPCTWGTAFSRRVVSLILRGALPAGTPCWPEVESREKQVTLVL